MTTARSAPNRRPSRRPTRARSTLCVSVAQPFTNGNTASVYPCNGQDSQNFEIQRGSGKIRMRADPSFCLDAGVEPHNGVDLKVRPPTPFSP
jgi:hypothetical protein